MVAWPGSDQLRLRLAWARPAMAPCPSRLATHDGRRPQVEMEDAVETEDGGRRTDGRGGERRCEGIALWGKGAGG